MEEWTTNEKDERQLLHELECHMGARSLVLCVMVYANRYWGAWLFSPMRIPERDSQCKHLMMLLCLASQGHAQKLKEFVHFVSGPNGAGKTHSVKRVAEFLQREHSSFTQVLFRNAKTQKLNSKELVNDGNAIVVIDEVTSAFHPDLRHLFGLLPFGVEHQHQRQIPYLIVISDQPVTVLPDDIQTRMGGSTIHFPPYQQMEFESILCAQIAPKNGLDSAENQARVMWTPEAIKFLALWCVHAKQDIRGLLHKAIIINDHMRRKSASVQVTRDDIIAHVNRRDEHLVVIGKKLAAAAPFERLFWKALVNWAHNQDDSLCWSLRIPLDTALAQFRIAWSIGDATNGDVINASAQTASASGSTTPETNDVTLGDTSFLREDAFQRVIIGLSPDLAVLHADRTLTICFPLCEFSVKDFQS